MSLTPLAIQNSFLMISKKRQPDAAKRGRLFEAAMMRLTQWWYENFQILDEGHICSRTFDQVKKAIENKQFQEDDGEVIRSSKSLMKHALMGRGCRDTSAQLFTALCRALGIPARLVVSIQSVPWQAKIGKPKPKTVSKSKSKTKTAVEPQVIDVDGDEDDMEEVAIPSTTVDVKGKGKGKAFPGSGQTVSGQVEAFDSGRENVIHKPVIKLRKSKPKGNRLGGSPRRRGESLLIWLIAPPILSLYRASTTTWWLSSCILDRGLFPSGRSLVTRRSHPLRREQTQSFRTTRP